MKKAFLTFLALTVQIALLAQSSRIRVSPNGHFLQYEDGTPFFWLGDTAWELFQRLTIEEITTYLDNREEKGFTVVQAVIIADITGKSPNKYGEYPLIDNNPDKPNEHYFQLVDTVARLTAERKMILALLPNWGDKVTDYYGGAGPVIFNETNAYGYGRYLGNRFKNYNHIIWILGGDTPPMDDRKDYRPLYAAMARGLDDGSERHTLKTFHPGGYTWETGPSLHTVNWLDINMNQSGHTHRDEPVWAKIARDWQLKPAKPTLDGEPCYEDHPVNPWNGWDTTNGYFRDYDVRKQLYRSVFAGACGVTYGHHAVWQFHRAGEAGVNHADRTWIEGLNRPGAYQAGYLKDLILSRPSLHRVREPDLVVDIQDTDPGLHREAFRDAENRYAMIYLPVGKEVHVNTALLKAEFLKASWFDPKTGKKCLTFFVEAKRSHVFKPPTLGLGNDWVLVLDAIDSAEVIEVGQ